MGHETGSKLDDPELHLQIPARADRVREVRDEVGRFGSSLGMSPNRVGDLKTIVDEACNNAVLHAYEEEGGVVEIGVGRPATGEVEVVVRDFGSGMFPRPDSDTPSLKMGLPIIGALSSSFTLSTRRGEGTILTVNVPID